MGKELSSKYYNSMCNFSLQNEYISARNIKRSAKIFGALISTT